MELKEELSLSVSKIRLLEQKIVLKDSVIKNLDFKVGNFESIMLTKTDQLALSQELSKRLQADLKKQKLKTKLMGWSRYCSCYRRGSLIKIICLI